MDFAGNAKLIVEELKPLILLTTDPEVSMEGRILGNRYELLEKIGGGGMATVYKARCRLLNRNVAVKILRQEFINDEEFVKRFKIEAQAAASLSHPNIVSIYDVGHEENIHYIVMEYIDGVTLKDYINQRKKLSWRQAVKVSIQICSAIEHAHRNHIVHRDIKPHNILITEDGIAKVTDFGIARAVSSSTITMVGSTIGSVHYFSPEQARGGYIDEKSDLYSLGIALYEMVTGRVPFDGETPVAIALKHLQDEAVKPIDIDESIPGGVNDIIMRAIKKDQSKRYQSATEMLRDLNMVLLNPNDSFEDNFRNEDAPTRRVKIVGDADFAPKEQNMRQEFTRREPVRQEPQRQEMPGRESVRDTRNEDKLQDTGSKNDKKTVWLAVGTSAVIIIVFVLIGFWFVSKTLTDPNEPAQVATDFKVKSYVNKNIDDVKAELDKAHIKYNINEKYSDKYEKGIIMSQSIPEGKPLKPSGYTSIDFDVSKGAEMVKLSDVKKQEYKTAKDTLERLGFVVKFQDEYSSEVNKDFIIRTDPDPSEKEEVPYGSTVTLYRSKGAEIKTTQVPDLIGRSRAEAENLLAKANLRIQINEDGKNYIDKIKAQNPAAKTQVDEGTVVQVIRETSTITRQNVNASFPLNDPMSYGEMIHVVVKITPSDTNKTETLMDERKAKGDFPLQLSVPVPQDGTTAVVVYLNNNRYDIAPLRADKRRD